jgi:diaminohydroxyphosphoribosylaminopyrimidine deaminase/5-amino-6-(5-phosphoribosylamino)uracil reductase
MAETDDLHWMRRALELAARGRGYVEPNPLVGAVVVRDGQVVGEGWHERFGGPHAEVHALAQAGPAARGATLYVTLEPCCHYGKTPPCTEAIVRAGIRRVVAALTDPFPEVAGRGGAQLQAAGVEYVVGLAEAEARRLNAPYLTLVTQGRPYVHAKWAMSLDGKLAPRSGPSRWLTGPAARQRSHQLRGRMDAILVGIGTVLADDPLLTPRPPGPRTPLRIVLDHKGRLPLTSQLVRTAREAPLLVAVTPQAPQDHLQNLRQQGCEVLFLSAPTAAQQVVELLAELGRRRLTNLLVEGGSAVLGSFLDADRIDEVHVFLAPCLLGSTVAPPALGGAGRPTLAEALRLADLEVERLGEDLYIHGWRAEQS